MLEQFVFMAFSLSQTAETWQPELILRGTSDGTFDAMREAEDFKHRLDDARLRFEVSCDTAGRQSFMEMANNELPQAGVPKEFLASATLFKGFKFKAKANSKDQAGSFNENFQKMLEGMGQIDSPQVTDAHVWMQKLNGEQFKNWAACIQYFKDNKGHANL